MSSIPLQSTVAAWKQFVEFTDRQLSGSADACGPAPGLVELCHLGAARLITAAVLGRATAAVERVDVPRLWTRLSSFTAQPDPQELEDTLTAALQDLCTAVQRYRGVLSSLMHHMLGTAVSAYLTRQDILALMALESQFSFAVSAAVLTLTEHSLQGILQQYYSQKLQQYSSTLLPEPPEDDEDDDDDEQEAMRDVMDVDAAISLSNGRWGQLLTAVSTATRYLGLQHINEEAYAAALSTQLISHLNQTTVREFEVSVVEKAHEYAQQLAQGFLKLLLPSGEAGAAELSDWLARLAYYVYDTLGTYRIGTMFDIVVDFPDSMPAVEDVRQCLNNTNLNSTFVSVFGTAIHNRLLHAGAATSDIIAHYVSTIKVLRHIDPSGVLLQAVGEPIREYLRSRKDTIRCIVTMLTDDGSGGESMNTDMLFEELGRGTGEAGEIADEDVDFETDEAALAAVDSWAPDPVDSNPQLSGDRHKMNDVISMLVAIYGSKELFINEYRSMLADKLLAKLDYECEREIRTLELLKLRFGEANMHTSEIMLKDLADSKRLNNSVQQLPNTATPTKLNKKALVDINRLSSTIISALFWPPLHEEDIKLPEEVEEMLDTYAAKYHSIKMPRKVVWKKSLGSVQLTVTVGGKSMDFTVPPVLATIIMHFGQQAQWTATALSETMGIKVADLRRKALFWINQGVLVERREGGNVIYSRAESLSELPASGSRATDEEDVAGQGDAAPDAKQQEMAVYESYIVGMLTNFDQGLPLDRIHNMLKMFVVEPPYDKSQEQLAAFLGRLVAEEKLTMEAGVFKKRT